MLTQKNKDFFRIITLFIITVLFFLFITAFIPLSSDDYEFTGRNFCGINDILTFTIHYGNGRVLGNLCSIILSRIPVLGTIIKALLISGVIFMVPTLLGVRDFSDYLLSLFLFLSIPASLFGQVYTWTSGFSNYVPPIWIALAVVMLLKKYTSLAHSWAKCVTCILIFIMGVAGQLYVEHSSISNVLLASYFLYQSYKQNRKQLPSFVWFSSTIIGLLIMLLVPIIFHTEGNRSDGYRSLNIGSISQLISSCSTSFISISNAYPTLASIFTSIAAMITTYDTRSRRSSKHNNFLYSAGIITFLFLFLDKHLLDNQWFIRLSNVRYMISGCIRLLPFLLWLITLRSVEDKKFKKRVLLFLGLALLTSATLLFVSPTPERVVFLPYVYTVAALIQFYMYRVGKMSTSMVSKIRTTLLCSASVLVLLLCSVFTNIIWIADIQEAYMQKELNKGNSTITVSSIPYDYVFWDGTWCYGWKYYHKSPYDVDFIEIEFDKWYNDYYVTSISN